MPTILPVQPGEPDQEFSTNIEGERYLFRFRWNARDAAWFMDIRESDDDPVVLGVKVVIGVWLGVWSVHQLFLQGVFVAYDTSGELRDATFEDFGTRVHVVWYNTAERATELLGS